MDKAEIIAEMPEESLYPVRQIYADSQFCDEKKVPA